MCLSFVFILLGVIWASEIWMSAFFPRSRELSAVVSLSKLLGFPLLPLFFKYPWLVQRCSLRSRQAFSFSFSLLSELRSQYWLVVHSLVVSPACPIRILWLFHSAVPSSISFVLFSIFSPFLEILTLLLYVYLTSMTTFFLELFLILFQINHMIPFYWGQSLVIYLLPLFGISLPIPSASLLLCYFLCVG